MLLPKRLTDEITFVNNDHAIGLYKNGLSLSSAEPGSSAYLVNIFARIDAEERREARVAHLGGGMGWLAKQLLGFFYSQEIFEIDPCVISFLREGRLRDKVNFVLGDWQRTLEWKYDIIIYDIDEPVDRERLYKHRAPGGTIYTLTD